MQQTHCPPCFGTVSLTGIMRILFGRDNHAAEVNLTGNDDKNPSEEEDSNGDNVPRPSPHPPEIIPTSAQRHQLLRQLNKFKDQLSASSFVKILPARQLQQAAAYPLAVAQFAARGPWIEPGERAALAKVVRDVCEVLFSCGLSATDPVTGKLFRRPPIIKEVRDRFAKNGQTSYFDQIIGDGTLWLVVLSSLAMMGESSETRFARNLAFYDVARFAPLSSSLVPEHVGPLVKKLWSDPSVELTDKIKQVVLALDALELYIGKHFDDWTGKVVSVAEVGDWLWHPKVGFSQVIELGHSSKALIHARKRVEDLKVELSYHINLRDISQRDGTLRSLFASSQE